MNTDPASCRPRSSHNSRRFLIYAIVLIVVFLAGFVPMWLKARTCSEDLFRTERQLAASEIENLIASAALNAQRGDYEPARQAASAFFTSLRNEFDKGMASAYPPGRQQALAHLLDFRDELITLLARNDPASAERLSDLYVLYRTSGGE
jgi:hypothetical protein